MWKAYNTNELRVEIAKEKLMGGKDSWEDLGEEEKCYSALAMMTSRFCLSVNPLAVCGRRGEKERERRGERTRRRVFNKPKFFFD